MQMAVELDRSIVIQPNVSVVEDWRGGQPQPYETIKVGDIAPTDEDRIFWNEPDGIVIRKTEYGGVLQKNWEASKDKLCGRFFFPDGNSLVRMLTQYWLPKVYSSLTQRFYFLQTWDVCARDRLRDFNLVCLKCGDVFACAPNNMTRTGNRHIKSKHPHLKCINASVPFYKQRSQNEPITADHGSDASLVDSAPASLDAIPLASANISKLKHKFPRCNEVDRKRLDRYLAALVARCGLPSNLADTPAFKEFVEELTNNEYVPGDAVLMEKEQDKMYTALMEELKLDFERQQPNGYFTLNADVWSFRSDVSFIVMTSYCIDSRWRHLKATTAVRAVPTDKVSSVSLDTTRKWMFCLSSDDVMLLCYRLLWRLLRSAYPASIAFGRTGWSHTRRPPMPLLLPSWRLRPTFRAMYAWSVAPATKYRVR
jgi:hypothetical protein